MRLDIDQDRNIRLRDVFSGVRMETAEGNAIGVCMRDDTLEINVMPGGKNSGNWWRVNMHTGQIEAMSNAAPKPCAECERLRGEIDKAAREGEEDHATIDRLQVAIGKEHSENERLRGIIRRALGPYSDDGGLTGHYNKIVAILREADAQTAAPKPRRMKANQRWLGSRHGVEHDEDEYCAKDPKCEPVDALTAAPEKKPRRMKANTRLVPSESKACHVEHDEGPTCHLPPKCEPVDAKWPVPGAPFDEPVDAPGEAKP